MTWVSVLFGSGGAIALAATVWSGAGHADVPARLAPPVEAVAPAGVQVARAKDGLFYLHAQINGRPVRFLVDTGASVTILTPADAARVGAQPRAGAGLRLRTASGHGTMRWADLESLHVGGRQLQHMDAAIGDRALPVSLLGQNVLTRLGSIRISGNALHLD